MNFSASLVVVVLLLTPLVLLAQDVPPAAKPDCAKPVQPTQCKCTRPEYPSAAARRNEQGVVNLKIHISADSKVTDVELIKSSGSRVLDKATLEHFQDVCFKAGVDSTGNPVASSATVEYVWRLE